MEIIHVLYPGLNGFALKQWNIRPSQVNSLFLVNFLAENLPSLQQKKNEGPKKNEPIYSVQRCNTDLIHIHHVIHIKIPCFTAPLHN